MKKTFTLLLLLVTSVAAMANDQWTTIQNGQLWLDDNGNSVQAHAPGFVRLGDTWYMVGEDRGNSWNPDVNLYRSDDLVHWHFVKKMIQNGVTTAELGQSRMIERPKLMHNTQTGRFVVWCHYESKDYGASEAACFESETVDGTYHLVWSGRPLGIKSRDCNVFQDTDGTAYFISTTEENQHLGLFRLSPDYHEAVSHTQLFPHQQREAPAIVRVGDTYFMFNSACSGWDPNQCKMAYTQDLQSGWTPLENIGNELAYDTQAAAILEIKGSKKTTYLYVGDRWQDPRLPESKTIIFPIEFEGTDCRFHYRERFDINFATGEWRETPREGLFADKSEWKVTKDSTSLTVDMGQMQDIKGFIAIPREEARARQVVRRYAFYTSLDGTTWEKAVEDNWLPYWAAVNLESRKARFVRLEALPTRPSMRPGRPMRATMPLARGFIGSISDLDVLLK